jgi:transposase
MGKLKVPELCLAAFAAACTINGNARRSARDFERYARTVAAFIHLAMIRIMLKRLVASSSS